MKKFRETNYLIGENGEVFNNKTKRFLKPFLGTDQYLYINLSNIYRTSLHRLVAEVYHGFEQNKEVNHIDGNKLNNHFSNLEWCDRSHNIKHSFKNRLQVAKIGSNNLQSKLNEEKVREIRILYKEGNNISDLSRRYGVTLSTISKILKRINWKHVE